MSGAWHELRPGLFHLVYNALRGANNLGEDLDRIDRDRALKGMLPCIAIVEFEPNAHPSHLQWVLERVTGSGPLRHARWQQPTSAGLLYGPKRAAAWRTVDAKHFGLPERRSIFLAIASGIDPSIIFDKTGAAVTAAMA